MVWLATLSCYHKNGSITTIVQTLEYYTTRVAEGIKLEYKFYTYRSNTSYQGSPTQGQISYYVRVNGSNIKSGNKSSITIPNKGTTIYLLGDEKNLLSHIIKVGETNSGSFTLSFETTSTSGIDNLKGSNSVSVSYSAYTTKGTITKVPFRYYINYGNNDRLTDTKFTGDFVNATNDVETDNYRDTVNSHNVVIWNKNSGKKFKLLLEYPKESKQWYMVYNGSGTSYNLSENKVARAVGLMSMEKGTNYYGGKTQPLSRFYDTRVALDSYNSSGSYIGSDYRDIRIEMYLPQVPSSISVTQMSGEDYAYESNEFKASWPVTSRCNQYVIRYAVNSPTNVNSWTQCAEDIVIDGHNTINTIIDEDSVTSKNTCISSLLAGQRIRFNMRGRCSLSTDYTIDNVTKTVTYTYDSAETSSVEIQKQGGMVTYINNKYQNCHVCVVDNNGKLVKALAAYVYAYKDGSTTEKEWRLIKMNS